MLRDARKLHMVFCLCVSQNEGPKEIIVYILFLSDPHFQGMFEAFNVRTHLGSDASPVSMVVFPSASLSEFVHARP